MNRIIDKFLLYIVGFAILIYAFRNSNAAIAVSLLAVLFSCANVVAETLPFLKDDEKKLKMVLFGIYIIFGVFVLFENSAACFMPVVMYDMWRYKLRAGLFVEFIIGIIAFALNFDVIYIFVLLLCAVALLISQYSSLTIELKNDLTRLRDDSSEQEELIMKSNKMLRENQDNMVYMATLQERNRIAREIHDNVGHLLTRSILQTGALGAINKDEKMKEPIKMLGETLNTAMTSIRKSVHDLHDESIDLRSAINEIITGVDGFSVTLDYDVSNEVPRDVKYGFIAITKEAVNNSVKYSNGDRISIIIREHPGLYQLLIEDNGENDTNNIDISSRGIGLQNIEDRAKELGGTVKISKEKGFRIFVSILKR